MAEPGSAIAPDVIDVRTDERFDEAALAAWLRGKLEGSERPLHVRQFGGGHANLTYLLRFGEGEDAVEYVLRRPPLGPVAPGSHDMRREYRALSVLWRAFPRAPRAFLFCDDPSVIGADFFVMERRHGVVVRGAIPPVFGGGEDPEANRKISETLIDTLAEFHEVDPRPIGLDALGKPDGFLRRQVSGWTDRYERAKVKPVPEAEEVARWLDENLPASPPWTLLHNDWKLDNVALDPRDPGRCVAVYDWDMCTVGDPLCDVGTLMCSWRDPDETSPQASAMPSQVPGFLPRDEALRRYAERRDVPLDDIPYYLVFGIFKMAVVVQQIYYRYHRGQTKDERFAGMGAAAEVMFRTAASRRP